MATIRLKGGAARNFIARQMVNDKGPEASLNASAGAMREAVEEVIKDRNLPVDRSKVPPEPGAPVRLGEKNAAHSYVVGVEGGYSITVGATNRDQAARIATKAGYVVRDVNMAG